jgi:hypothetical protein
MAISLGTVTWTSGYCLRVDRVGYRIGFRWRFRSGVGRRGRRECNVVAVAGRCQGMKGGRARWPGG